MPHAGKQVLKVGGDYRIIFKCGDDLRQDQLVIQLFTLMDSLLKRVKLDLKFTPFKVLATSANSGFVEFVANSHTLEDILRKKDTPYKDLKSFLEKHNPQPRDYQRALDNFTRSSAGTFDVLCNMHHASCIIWDYGRSDDDECDGLAACYLVCWFVSSSSFVYIHLPHLLRFI